jgi:phospholipid N-methyltransferase
MNLAYPEENRAAVTAQIRPAVEEPQPTRLSVLMPVYNEFWTLRTIVARVLSSPVAVDLELVIVDDCSTDGSWDLIQELATAEPRIRPFRHERNAGKGAALRTAIAQAIGEIAIVQDADLEYDPHEFPALLQPILDGKADAVFGSRYAGATRRVSPFWHTMINKGLTLLSNVANNLCLTDMETCYKMVRTDVLKRLRLKSKSFTFEPELTCRLAQWGARIWEVPISYSARTYLDGKKIRPRDGLLALWEIVRSRYLDPQFTTDSKLYSLTSAAQSPRYQSRIAKQIEPYVGQRVLETGAGLGALSGFLVRREQLTLTDDDPLCVHMLRQRFGGRNNVQIERLSLSAAIQNKRWKNAAFDTVVCSRGLEGCSEDQETLAGFYDLLPPGGHCIVMVPGGSRRLTPLDQSIGIKRRYNEQNLAESLASAGFEVVDTQSFDKLTGLLWQNACRILGPAVFNANRAKFAERLLPVTRFFDAILPGEGHSILAVGRKPMKAAGRAAA